MGPLFSDLSHLENMKRLQAISDQMQLLIHQRNANVVNFKSEVGIHVEGIQSVIEKSKVEFQEGETKTTNEDHGRDRGGY